MADGGGSVRERQRPYIPTVRWRGIAHVKTSQGRGMGRSTARYGGVVGGYGRNANRRPAAWSARRGHARATRGSRGRGVDGGAVPGAGSTVCGPADLGRPRRPGLARPRRGRRAASVRPARSRVPVPAKAFQADLFDRANLQKVEQKWSK
jgi:hypothetical protein